MLEKITIERLVRMGVEKSAAKDLLRRIRQYTGSPRKLECWQKVSKELLKPDHPFELHKILYKTIFSDWDPSQGPPPAWIPTEEFIKSTNVARLMDGLKLDSYEQLHAWSVKNREAFWDILIKKLRIQFKQTYKEIVNLSSGAESPRWLVDAKLNIADSCFNAPNNAIAVVYQNINGSISKLTYEELDSLSNRVANGLGNLGFNRGDAIAVTMAMKAESVAIYLGIVKAGCVVVSIADSFAPPEIKKRLCLAEVKGIFTQDYILHSGKRLPMYEKVESANAPRAVVLPSADLTSVKLRKDDILWDEFLSNNTNFSSVSCDPADYLNILFSSGTTGDPKAIPWTHTTPIKCAADGFLHHNIQPGDVVAWPTNLGWMMGPWLIYASLINKAAMALYGDVPTTREFGRFVQNAKVTMLGLVPIMVKHWRNNHCMQGLDWSNIKAYSSTGECSNAEDMLFLMSLAGYKPIIEYCGGTEIGGGYLTGTVVQPACPATFTTPALGLDFVIMDEKDCPADNGEVFLIPPSIGLSTELLNMDHHEVYFEGTPKGLSGEQLRRHGDQIECLPGGYFRCLGRVDDTMNLGGIKVSSAEIERTLSSISDIAEVTAVAVSPENDGPTMLVIYIVPSTGFHVEKEVLKKTMQDTIKRDLNPLFKIHDVVLVDSLPRTTSNKVMRRALRDMYEKLAILCLFGKPA